MNSIGTLSSLPMPTVPKAAPVVVSAPALPLPQPAPEVAVSQPEVLDTKLVVQQSAPQVQKPSEPIANPQILGTTTFITIRDAGGTLVTRFRDVTTGKITYLPREPEVMRVDIKA